MVVTVAPEITSSWTEMIKDDSHMNWIAIRVDDNVAHLTGTGEGGIHQLNTQFVSSEVQFAILKVEAIDDLKNAAGHRTKYLFITWIGSGVPLAKKTKVAMQAQAVGKVFPGISLYVQASEIAELDPSELHLRLLQIGGAHKPTKYKFGPDCEVVVKSPST
jgi:hypothetical protein